MSDLTPHRNASHCPCARCRIYVHREYRMMIGDFEHERQERTRRHREEELRERADRRPDLDAAGLL